jgi:hypothetical protein
LDEEGVVATTALAVATAPKAKNAVSTEALRVFSSLDEFIEPSRDAAAKITVLAL